MIGILCNSGKEHKYSYELNALIKKLNKSYSSFGVFSIDNINLKDKTFYGNFISEENIKPVTLKLPEVIFNFSLQSKNSNIKKVRQIAELEEIQIINEANRYRQKTIMEILSSSKDNKKYVFPYEKINSSTGYFFDSKPRKLLAYNSSVPVFRIYMQRSIDGIWKFISSSVNLKEAYKSIDSSINLEVISLSIINYVCKFIPSIGICFIDYIIDNSMNPYFLRLGGFNRILLSKRIDSITKEAFINNLLDFRNFLERQPGGE